MQSLEVDIRQDIFIGTAAKPEIADMIRRVDLIRLYVCSDGDDKGAVLNLERKFYAEFFSDHFMTGGGLTRDFHKVRYTIASIDR